jgi:arylsulfatase
MATCLDAAGAKYPSEYKGNRVTPLEGRSLLPIIEGGKRTPHDGLFWEHEGNRAIREGDWKLVSRYPDKWELFNLKGDRTELTDLASKESKLAERLASRYEAWSTRAQVVPWSEVLKAPRVLTPA